MSCPRVRRVGSYTVPRGIWQFRNPGWAGKILKCPWVRLLHRTFNSFQFPCFLVFFFLGSFHGPTFPLFIYFLFRHLFPTATSKITLSCPLQCLTPCAAQFLPHSPQVLFGETLRCCNMPSEYKQGQSKKAHHFFERRCRLYRNVE